ncbi:MAG: putative AfsR family transcriptional regulator [Frankiales bacterium]|nr:putative AfsR family transcriptional regulator [Frankiales bacterium]
MGGTAPTADAPVYFLLFGGVRIVRGDAEVELRQPKQRAILALLLSTPGEPVSVSEIIDALWSDEPAASVTNQIHRHVGSLRRACQPELQRRQIGRYILPAGTGYRLVAGSEDCDVLRFRSLVQEAYQLARIGEGKQAGSAFFSSLAVAAAPAGDDTMWTLPAFVGLEDERVRAIIAAVEHCETPDEFGAVLPILRAAAARHRLDEALHAKLMTALTRTGRVAEALEVYAGIRGALREELGSSPSAVLETAQAHALRTDLPSSSESTGSSRAATVRPAQLPSPPPAFAGRRDLLATLRNDREGRARVLLITGMGGVGKTTLALRVADELAHHHSDGQLYVNLRGFDATAPPTDPLDALRDMLEGLGLPSPSLPESVDARSGLLRSILSEQQVLVVLDNARDYHQVEPLLPGAGASRVIITSRNWMPGLAAFHQARPIHLEPFDDDEVVEFFSQRLTTNRASDDRDAMIRLGRACGGLPLALAIVVARASANPAFPLDLLVREFTQERTPLESLNAGSAELDLGTVFSWSHRGLSDEAARTLALLSAHPGPEFSTAAAMSISALDPRRAREVLNQLTLASVLRESRPGRFAFHDLVREYALSLLADDAFEASARLVNHYVRSTRQAILTFGQPSVAPVDDTVPRIVPEVFASSRDATRWYTEERRVLHQVCRLAVSLGDHRSALMLMLDWRPMSQAVDARHDMLPFAELAIQAAEHVDEPALLAECYRDVASNFARTGHPERARRYFDLAAAMFERSGDRVGQANVYRSMAVTLVMDPTDRIELLRASVTVARQLDDQPILATSLHSLGLGLLWGGRFDDALAAFDECTTITATVPDLAYLEPHVLSGRSRALAGTGRLEESADEAARALELLRRGDATEGELRLLRSHGDALTALGRTGEAAEAWRRFLTLATSPERVRETNAVDDDTDGSVTIDRVKAKLVALTVNGDEEG